MTTIPTRLRLGFDVNELVEHYPSGVSRYTTNLFHALREVGGTDLHPVARLARIGKRARMVRNGIDGPIRWSLNPLLPLGGFDILHYPAGRFIPVSGRHRRVITIHDLWEWHKLAAGEFSDPTNAVLRTEEMLRESDGIICISEATKRDLQRFYPTLNRPMVVIHHGVDERFSRRSPEEIAIVRAALGLPVEYLLALGHYHPRKNAERMVRAFKTLPFDTPPLVLAGNADPARGTAMATLADAPGPRVIQIGYISDDQASALLSGARLVIFTPLFEGFGLPLIEAYRCGTPVLAASGSSLDELVHPSAIQVDPNDESAIARGIVAALARPINESIRSDLGKYSEIFTWARCARESLAFYRSVAAAPSTRGRQ